WAMSFRLANTIFAQSRTSDWLRSLLINDQIRWRDDFFAKLVEIVQNAAVNDPDALITRLTNLARSIFETNHEQPASRVGGLDLSDLLQRTAVKYASLLAGVDNAARRQVLVLIFLIMDNVADLDERKKIDIVTISPPGGLCGEQLQAFGGFFKKEWRE